MAKTNRTIADVLKEAGKKYNIEIGFDDECEAISTGNVGIDYYSIGPGGFPLGRSVELYGPPSSGKTTLALQTAAVAQKKIKESGSDQVILYLDYEHALDANYCMALGLDINDEDTFIVVQPSNFEDGANFAREMISTGQVLVAIWDSVASMVPKAVEDEETGKALVAPLARVFSPFLSILNPLLNEHNTLAIFINHLREKIGGMPSFAGPQKSTPGGTALKFYSSVRLEFSKFKTIKETRTGVFGESTKINVATEVKVRVEKNKVGPPGREIVLLVRYGKGFDNFDTAVRVLQGAGLIHGSAGYCYFDKLPDLIQPDMPVSAKNLPYVRSTALEEYAEKHPYWAEKIIAEAANRLAEGVQPVLQLEPENKVSLGLGLEELD